MSEATQKCENRSIFMQNHQTLKAFIVFKKPIFVDSVKGEIKWTDFTEL